MTARSFSALAIALALPSLASAGGFATTLTLGGECPGPATIEITGTPGGTFVLVAGDAAGSTTIPGGSCAGLDLGVESEGVLSKFGPLIDADGDGVITMTPDLPEAACTMSMQALNTTECTVSNVEDFVEDPNTVYAVDGRCGSGTLYALDLDTGEETSVPLTRGYTGIAFATDGNLYGVSDGCSGNSLYRIDPATGAEEAVEVLGEGCSEYDYYGWYCISYGGDPVPVDNFGNESGISARGDGLWITDASSQTYEISAGLSTTLGFSSVNCCGGDIAEDASGTMWYADSGSGVGTVDDFGSKSGTLFDFFDADKGITFHNGGLIGAGGSCGANLQSLDTVTGAVTDLGFGFSSCSIDGIASPSR